jgi:hypothetical protein
MGKYSRTSAKVRLQNNTAVSNYPSIRDLPVESHNYEARCSLSNSTMIPTLQRACMDLILLVGELSVLMLDSASFSFLAMSVLEVPGGKRCLPSWGSNSIWCALMAARPTTWSTYGGR